jgi:hypothetical protein
MKSYNVDEWSFGLMDWGKAKRIDPVIHQSINPS